MNTIKQKLAAGEVTVGAWLSVPSPLVAEAMASCGFDWMAVDMEHSPVDEADAAASFIAAERHGCAPFVRLPHTDTVLARRLLDTGAEGLIVPNVESAAEFRTFASHCIYSPGGRRGTGLSRANLWGDTFADYRSGFRPVLVPQIESRAGVAAAAEVAALAEVDALFIGPYDLSADLGSPGDFSSDAFKDAMAGIKAACADAGKAAGIHQVAPVLAELEARIAEGYRFLAYGTDMIGMRHAFRGLDGLKRVRP